MASDLKKKLAAGLKALIGKKAIIDIAGGPSKSYIYRMRKGANPSIEELEAVLRAYGSSLGDFFAPWREGDRAQRQKHAADIRQAVERIIEDETVDLSVVSGALKVWDPSERTSGKRRSGKD